LIEYEAYLAKLTVRQVDLLLEVRNGADVGNDLVRGSWAGAHASVADVRVLRRD
jgi:hypothetical protein